MKQVTKRFLSLIISFTLFVATLIIYFNLIVPANNDGQVVKADMLSRENFINSQKSAINQVKNLITSYKGEGQLQEVVSSILPFSGDLAGSFSQVSGLVQANHLLMDFFIAGTPVEIPSAGDKSSQLQIKGYGSTDFQLQVTGTYEDFKSFIANMETNIRIFDIKKIDIQPAGKPNQDFYTYNLTVATYYQIP